MPLSIARNTRELQDRGKHVVIPVAASTTIYAGGMVAKNASGYAVPASADNTLIVIGRNAGVVGAPSIDAQNVAGANLPPFPANLGSAGAISIIAERGVFKYDINSSDIDFTMVGLPCYVVDDHTVSSSSSTGSRPIAGRIVRVDDNQVYVDFWEQNGANIAAGGVGTSALANSSVTTAKLAAGAVTGAKMASAPFVTKAFVGHSGAGACTATGLTVGQRVVVLFGAPTAGGALVEASGSFESTITVNDQIQQSSASNLSGNTYIVIVEPIAA